MTSTQEKKVGAQLRQRGQAMVEFSILMLLFIPILLYGFFLADAAYHQLEVQETVISTIWDFSQRNAQPAGTEKRDNVVDATVRAAHIMYMDHTSSYDEISPSTLSDSTKNDIALSGTGSGSGSAKHHNQFAAHACFVNYQSQWHRKTGAAAYDDPKSKGASNVACTVNAVDDTSWITGGAAGGAHLHPAQAIGQSDTLAKGGLVYCWARGRIYNYLVPDQFLQDFSHVDLSQGKTDHDTVSTNSMSDGDAKAPHKLNEAATDLNSILLRDKAALSYDTWAVDNGAEKMHDARDRTSGARNTDLTSDDEYNPSLGLEDNETANLYFARVANVYGSDPFTTLSTSAGTYATVFATTGIFMGKALPWMIVNPNPLLYGSFTLSRVMNMIPVADSPLGTHMSARYARGTSNTTNATSFKEGYASPCAFRTTIGGLTDIFQCIAKLSKYETTPFAYYDSSNSIPMKMYNARGAFYMGSTDQSTVWKP